MKKRSILIFLSMILLAFLLNACSSQPAVTYIEGEEYTRVAELAAPYAEHILQGIETNDRDLFIIDFAEKMATAMDAATFEKIVKTYGALGSAQSCELINIEDRGDYYGVNYKVTFKDKTLIMNVVVDKAEPNWVSGLWFR